jgi:hypothetical protein
MRIHKWFDLDRWELIPNLSVYKGSFWIELNLGFLCCGVTLTVMYAEDNR